MNNLEDLKKAISQTYILDENQSFIESGEIIAIYYSAPRYYITEYVKYQNKIILLLHNLFESYHFTLFNVFYVNVKSRELHYSYKYKEMFEESLTKTNLELSEYVNFNKVRIKKISDINQIGKHKAWFNHKRKGVLYRKNWNTIPNLILNYFDIYNTYALVNGPMYQYANAYLTVDNKHKEYLWSNKKHA